VARCWVSEASDDLFLVTPASCGGWVGDGELGGFLVFDFWIVDASNARTCFSCLLGPCWGLPGGGGAWGVGACLVLFRLIVLCVSLAGLFHVWIAGVHDASVGPCGPG
jgi:hypothetical protein